MKDPHNDNPGYWRDWELRHQRQAAARQHLEDGARDGGSPLVDALRGQPVIVEEKLTPTKRRPARRRKKPGGTTP